MSHSLPQPSPVKHGGRVELRLQTASNNQPVIYAARWFLLDRLFEGAVTISLQDEILVKVSSNEPLPEWLDKFTITLARTTARSAKSDQFPRRLTRWRAAPNQP